VFDDGADPASASAVCREFSFVRYYQGPKRGLCANRNAAIAHVNTEYVSLIDDDGIVSSDFVEQLQKLLPNLDGRTLITGDVLEYGGRSMPRNPSFLGHFGKTPKNEPLQTIALNCNCIPTRAFSVAMFDESLVYGYEDMDLCSQLLRRGFRIEHVPSLVNKHDPPARTGEVNDYRYRYTQQARFRTSMMRYLVWQRKMHLAALYLGLAPLHRAIYDLKTKRLDDLKRILPDIVSASAYAVQSLRKDMELADTFGKPSA
jgi:GT2 family glycosyltransferase